MFLVDNNGAVANVLDCDLEVCEFKTQSNFYLQFPTNTLGNFKNPIILPAMS